MLRELYSSRGPRTCRRRPSHPLSARVIGTAGLSSSVRVPRATNRRRRVQVRVLALRTVRTHGGRSRPAQRVQHALTVPNLLVVCLLPSSFPPTESVRQFTASPGCPSRFGKGLCKPASGLTFRCPAKLHATRQIRATRNEPLFRGILVQDIDLKFRNETAGFQNERRSLEEWTTVRAHVWSSAASSVL